VGAIDGSTGTMLLPAGDRCGEEAMLSRRKGAGLPKPASDIGRAH
jgi:hypothetical protein